MMKLENIVPFGRSFDEYCKIFHLTEDDFKAKIVGVGDGPASFNGEMHGRGRTVVSVDPLYCFKGQEIEQQFHHVLDDVIEQVKNSPDDWVWSYHSSLADLKANRIKVMSLFVEDYEEGQKEGRYITGQLPELPFDDESFDLALCSHFLFLYGDRFDYEFHRQSILDMLRIADDVRIFPLVDLTGKKSNYIAPLMNECKAKGYQVDVVKVTYELQRGGNEMLRVRKT